MIAGALDTLNQGNCCGGRALVNFPDTASFGLRFSVKVWNTLSRTFKLAAGSFVYCPKELFDLTGGFSEKVYAGEEIFFSRRLKKAGKSVGKKKFIIQPYPVLTSARKEEWFSVWQMISQMLRITFMPWTIKSSKNLQVWYKRPDQSGNEQEK